MTRNIRILWGVLVVVVALINIVDVLPDWATFAAKDAVFRPSSTVGAGTTWAPGWTSDPLGGVSRHKLRKGRTELPPFKETLRG